MCSDVALAIAYINLSSHTYTERRSLTPRGLGRGSAAARLLGLQIRIPRGAYLSASCECCVLSGKVL